MRSAQQNADDSCTGEDQDEEHLDDSVEPPPVPTSTQTLAYIDSSRGFWESEKVVLGYTDEAFDLLNRLEEMTLESRPMSTTQSKITNFFRASGCDPPKQ